MVASYCWLQYFAAVVCSVLRFGAWKRVFKSVTVTTL